MPDLIQAFAPLPPAAIVCTSCGHTLGALEKRDPLATAGPEESGEPQSCDLCPGTLLAERYRIMALIGHGGMGEVYQAEDLTLQQVVALKFLPRHLQSDRRALTRFHREVSLARRISHPNVCRVFDIGYAEGLAFLTMEYVAGDDLRSLQERIGRLPYSKGLEIALQLCYGLAAAHDEGVLHHDLKPANIMLDRRGNVRITDFGLAAPLGETDQAVVGTPVYMAPEQICGEAASVHTDLYSLGVVLREIFTGESPLGVALHGERISLANGGLPSFVNRAISQCLEPDPSKRPQSAGAVAEALANGGPFSDEGRTTWLDLRRNLGWLLFAAALTGLAVVLIMTMRAAVDFGLFDQRAANASEVLFTWGWCIAAQLFLVFLAVAFLLRQRASDSR